MTQTETAPTSTRTDSSWRRLLFRSAIASIVVLVIVQLLAREVIPPLIIGTLLLIGGVLWLRRPGRGPVIFLAVVSVLLLLGNLGFAIPALGHPESAFDFVSVGAILVSLIVTAAVAIAALRSTRDVSARAPRMIALGAVGVVVLMAIVGGIAAASLEDDAAVSGDLALGAKSSEWTADTLTAKAGTVGVLVDNADATRHDFVIKDAGAKVTADLPELTKRRVTFEAKPGSYDYVCTIHPNMKGKLTVG